MKNNLLLEELCGIMQSFDEPNSNFKLFYLKICKQIFEYRVGFCGGLTKLCGSYTPVPCQKACTCMHTFSA